MNVLCRLAACVAVSALAACAPSAAIDSKKFPGYSGGAKNVLLVYSLSPGYVDTETVKARMTGTFASCGIDTRFIFVEASYGGSNKDAQQKILDEAKKRVADFREDAILLIAESSKMLLVDRYGGSRTASISYQASLFDKAAKAKMWMADVSLRSGNVFQNSRDRADVLSRNLALRLIDDGVVAGCPDGAVRPLRETPAPAAPPAS